MPRLTKMRRPRKPRARKPKTSTQSKVVKIVKNELHKQIENKIQRNVSILDVVGEMAPVYCFKVIPQVIQGTQQGQRVGNRIRPVSLRVGVAATMFNRYQGPIDSLEFGRTGVYFDTYVFQCIGKPSYDQALTAGDMDTFLQSAGSYNRYVGSPFNWLQSINKDRFKCLFRTRKLLNSIGLNQSSGLNSDKWGQNTNSAYTITIPLTKKTLKQLKFNDNNFYPENQAIYIVTVATRADLMEWDDYTLPVGQVCYFSEMFYEDA